MPDNQKKYQFIILLILFCAFNICFANLNAVAQPQVMQKRLENVRLKFMKERLNLKPEQVAPFEALYLEYIRKKRDILQAERTLKMQNSTLTVTDAELTKAIDDYIKLKKEEVEIEVTYKDKFLKVITIRQLAELYFSEREFLRMMLQRQGGGGGRMMPNDIDDN